MKPILIIMLMLCLTIVGTASAAAPAAPVSTAPATTQAISNTRYAYDQVQVPRGEFAPSADEILSLLSRNAQQLAPKVLGVPWDIVGGAPGRNAWFWISSNEAFINFSVAIPRNAAPPVAKEFLDAVLAKSQDQVKQLYAQTRLKPLKDATRAAAEAQQRYDQAADELRELRDKLRASAGRADVSPQSISDALSKLEEEKQKLELDVMGKQARRDALDQQIAKQSVAIENKVQEDPIAAQLQKVVDARQEKVKILKQLLKSGAANPTELSDAIAAAADAEAKLLQRRHDAAAEAGGDALLAFNRDALTLSVDLSEAKARLKFIQDRLTHLASASDRINQLERARAQEQSAAEEVNKRTKALHELEETIASLPPGELTVISSQNSATPPDNGGQSAFGGQTGGSPSPRF